MESFKFCLDLVLDVLKLFSPLLRGMMPVIVLMIRGDRLFQGGSDLEHSTWKVMLRIFYSSSSRTRGQILRTAPRLRHAGCSRPEHVYMLPVDVVPRVSAGRLVIGV